MITEQELRQALTTAWNLGQTYWQQADSEFYSQQAKSDATREKFRALVERAVESLHQQLAAPLGEGGSMNFAQMLATTVTPLYTEEEQPKKRSGNPHPNAEKGWKSLMAQTEGRYRAVMGDKWVGTREIENRLGLALATARRYLTDRVNDGKMERRKVGPVDCWTRGKGYEWRWK